jgi:hypothetical protein
VEAGKMTAQEYLRFRRLRLERGDETLVIDPDPKE